MSIERIPHQQFLSSFYEYLFTKENILLSRIATDGWRPSRLEFSILSCSTVYDSRRSKYADNYTKFQITCFHFILYDQCGEQESTGHTIWHQVYIGDDNYCATGARLL